MQKIAIVTLVIFNLCINQGFSKESSIITPTNLTVQSSCLEKFKVGLQDGAITELAKWSKSYWSIAQPKCKGFPLSAGESKKIFTPHGKDIFGNHRNPIAYTINRLEADPSAYEIGFNLNLVIPNDFLF